MQIQGTASSFKGENVVIQTYQNFITNSTKTLKKISLNEDGKFSVDLNIEQQTLLILKIRDRSSDFYVLPGKNYSLLIEDDGDNDSRLFDKRLLVKFQNAAPNELNTLIAEFAGRYAQFLDEHYQSFLTSGANQLVADFKSENLAYFSPKGNEVFMESLKYMLGNLEDATVHNKKTLYNELLRDKSILYHNQEYMTFFVQFYQDRFRQQALGKDGFEMLTCINQTTDLNRLKTVIKKDQFLTNDKNVELYVINGLYEVYNDPTFKKKMVEKMLNYIAGNSKYTQHRNISKNILSELNFLQPGSKAPAFALTSAEGKSITSDALKGQYKYVQFWATWSLPSVKEQLLINRLYEKYGDKIQFVSISNESLNHFLTNHSKPKYPWTFLFSTDKSEVFESYRVRSVPTYLMLDESNNIVQYPAESPVSIEKMLYEISTKQ